MDYGFFDVMKMNVPDPANVSRGKSVQTVNGRFPSDTPLAMAYVPFQTFETIYDPEQALDRGTIFPELDFPLKHDEEGWV